MAHRSTVDILTKNLSLLPNMDVEAEATKWDWAYASQVQEWIEQAGCARGDVARALRNVGCTPQLCSRHVLAEGKASPIGMLAAEGKITIQEARRLALSPSDKAVSGSKSG
jgi:hypothetical protein